MSDVDIKRASLLDSEQQRINGIAAGVDSDKVLVSEVKLDIRDWGLYWHLIPISLVKEGRIEVKTKSF